MENKTRIPHRICGKSLSVVLSAAMIASVGAVATVGVSALSSTDLSEHTVGITGAFAECDSWKKDIPMTDNSDGTYSAEITGQQPGEYEFKVRLDGSWDYNWGDYEWEDPNGEPADRTMNSQHNCKVTVTAETDVIKVTFDTTKISDDALAEGSSVAHELSGADDKHAYFYWPVTYEVVDDSAEEPTEEPSEEPVTSGDFEYSKNSDGTVTITKYNGNNTELTIPSEIDGMTVKEIGDGAFCVDFMEEPLNLKNVTIPGSVEKIGNYAFSDCKNLEKITLQDGVKEIGDSAFSCCYNIKSITIPGSVEKIGDCAFSSCENLEKLTLENGVKEIGDGAFSGVKFTSIYIPASVTSISPNSFDRTLKSIDIDENNKAYLSKDGVLFSKDGTKLLLYIDKDSSSYTIPDTVKEIGENAFAHAYALKSLTIPNTVKEIGERAFIDCNNLQSITIPGSVEKIGDSAFYACDNLEKVTIQNGVKEIGKYAFIGGKYTSITIPASVTKIGLALYPQQTPPDNLKNINVDKDNPVYSSKDGVLFNKDGTKLLFYPHSREATFSVLDGVKEIGDYAFSSFYKFKYTGSTLTIPESVEVIGEGAFMGCSLPEKLILGKNVKSIGKDAFFANWKDRVKEVTFPENIEYIGLRAFETIASGWTKENIFNGYTGSYADLYCKAYGYKFVSIGTAAEKPELKNDEFGIKVKGSFPDGAKLSVEKATSKLIPDAVFCYNISLNKDNKAVQPTGFVTVSIPCDVENCRVFYEDFENNTLVDMNAVYLDGCYVFATNHFSDYIIVPYDTELNANVIQPSYEVTNSSEKPNNNNNNNNSNNNNNNNNTNNNTNNGNNNATNNNDVPPTGDNSFAMIALTAMAVSGAVVLLAKNRKRKAE
ncbi:MAG: leucine-rich repeat protein [Acutalibacteraceae bacterium]